MKYQFPRTAMKNYIKDENVCEDEGRSYFRLDRIENNRNSYKKINMGHSVRFHIKKSSQEFEF